MLTTILEHPLVSILFLIAIIAVITSAVKIIMKIAATIFRLFITIVTVFILLILAVGINLETNLAMPNYQVTSNTNKKLGENTFYANYLKTKRVNEPKQSIQNLDLVKQDANILVVHEHYHYTMPTEKKYPRYNQKKVTKKNVNSLEVSEITLETSFCTNTIPNNRYIFAVSFNEYEYLASNYVEELKDAGFHSANYFWLPCYESDRDKELFVVSIDRPCQTKRSIKQILQRNINKATSKGIIFPSKTIIFIYEDSPSVNQSSDWDVDII